MFSKSDGTRAQQKEATARAILDAARAEFEEAGFERANLRSIAARAGVSAGSVVHHFGSKRDLLHAAFFADLDAVLRQALRSPGPGPLEAQLHRLSRTVFDYYRDRPRLSRTLLAQSLFAEPPWAERFVSQVRDVHATVARLARDASERGELASDVSFDRLAASYLSFYYFALIGWAQGTLEQPESLVAGLLEQHLRGLR